MAVGIQHWLTWAEHYSSTHLVFAGYQCGNFEILLITFVAFKIAESHCAKTRFT